jgi:hypothetical protein
MPNERIFGLAIDYSKIFRYIKTLFTGPVFTFIPIVARRPTMRQMIIENSAINSPFAELASSCPLDDKVITNETAKPHLIIVYRIFTPKNNPPILSQCAFTAWQPPKMSEKRQNRLNEHVTIKILKWTL